MARDNSNANGDDSSADVHLVLNGKGGVGKSLVATWLAEFLISRGRLVRCIDGERARSHTLRNGTEGTLTAKSWRSGGDRPSMHANKPSCDYRLCLEDGGSAVSPFRHSRGECLCGRERRVRARRQASRGRVHEIVVNGSEWPAAAEYVGSGDRYCRAAPVPIGVSEDMWSLRARYGWQALIAPEVLTSRYFGPVEASHLREHVRRLLTLVELMRFECLW